MAADSPPVQSTPHRVLALDILRGASMAAMLFVNYPGDKTVIWQQLRHVSWLGLHLADLIFPFFLFAVGASLQLSQHKRAAPFDRRYYGRVLWRALKLFLLGLLLLWLKRHELRFGMGTLQHIAVAYLLGALFLPLSHRGRAVCLAGLWAAGLAILYGLMPEGTPWLERFAKGHTGMEQLEAAYPLLRGFYPALLAAGSVLIGIYAGGLLIQRERAAPRAAALGIIATVLGALPALAPPESVWWLPFSLKLWTPSYTVFCGGLAFLCLAALLYLTDTPLLRASRLPFIVLGANPITAYLSTSLLDRLVLRIPLAEGGRPTIRHWLYEHLLAVAPPPLSSYLFSTIILLFAWLLCYALWRRRIFLAL